MSYYTHHKHMDAPQYVYVDVISGTAVARMSYYTHHKHMDAPQDVHFDVPSVYTCYRMSYYTHHKDMYVPQYVYPVERKKGVIIVFKKVEKTL